MRQSERDGAEQISVNVEHHDEEADIGFAWSVALPHMLSIVDDQPRPKHQQPAGERDEMHRIEKVEDAAGQRQHRESADAARPLRIRASEEIFKRQAEKEAQPKKEGDADGSRRGDHEKANVLNPRTF